MTDLQPGQGATFPSRYDYEATAPRLSDDSAERDYGVRWTRGNATWRYRVTHLFSTLDVVAEGKGETVLLARNVPPDVVETVLSRGGRQSARWAELCLQGESIAWVGALLRPWQHCEVVSYTPNRLTPPSVAQGYLWERAVRKHLDLHGNFGSDGGWYRSGEGTALVQGRDSYIQRYARDFVQLPNNPEAPRTLRMAVARWPGDV